MARVESLSIPGPESEMAARLYVALGAPQPPQPLLVYFHGGGWVIGDLDTHDGACRFLTEHSGCRVLSVDYRLAPEHPFPAQLEDAVVAYRWLLDQGIDAATSSQPVTRPAGTWPRPCRSNCATKAWHCPRRSSPSRPGTTWRRKARHS